MADSSSTVSVAGDRVAIVCENNRYFVVSYLAVVGLGAIAVPLNPASPAPELERELGVVEPVAAVVGPSAAAASDQVDRAAIESLTTRRPGRGDLGDGEVAFGVVAGVDPSPVRRRRQRPHRGDDVHERHRRLAACGDVEPLAT